MLAIYHFLSLIFSLSGFALSCLLWPLSWLYERNIEVCLWADQNIDTCNGEYEARIKRPERAFVAYNHGIDILEIEQQIRAELQIELQEELQAELNSKLGSKDDWKVKDKSTQTEPYIDSRVSIKQMGENLTKVAEELKK